MKVICILEPRSMYDSDGNRVEGVVSPIRVGNEYNIVLEVELPEGCYYKLNEIKEKQLFHSELFAKLSDIDETELINEREEVYAG